MENPQLAGMRELLRKAKLLPKVVQPEKTIFSIGGRGHWENPTTEILAFFCDNNAAHGLGDLVLKSLFDCLDRKYHQAGYSLKKKPERELVTPDGSRIDLLLESEDWVIVLENKIFHDQINPFKEYEAFVDQDDIRFRQNKEYVIFVVLSPEGKVAKGNERWVGISYENLISAIKLRLAEHFISNPLNKWLVLLREFVLHLEGLLVQQLNTVEQENIDFVLKNIHEIKSLVDLKMLAIGQWHEWLRKQLQEKMSKKVSIKLHDWGGLPALRFSCETWVNCDNDVVLYPSENENEGVIKYFALLENNDVNTIKSADDALIDVAATLAVRPHMEGMYRTYECYVSLDNIVDELYKKITLLDTFYHQKCA